MKQEVDVIMEEILRLIEERQSLRTLFDPDRAIVKEALKQILEAGSWAPTAHNMQNFEIVVVDDKDILDRMSKIENPVSSTFIKENYQQLSFSVEELQKKKVGILADMFPPSWKTPEARQGIVPDNNEASSLGKPVQNGPIMLIVLYDPGKRAPASEGDFLGIISLGCVMENMWLMAHSLGVGFHIMSVISSDSIEKEVKSILNIPDNLKIAFSCRLGYPISKPGKYLRVRRNVDNFTHHNRFDHKGID
jgi:nitroreductase